MNRYIWTFLRTFPQSLLRTIAWTALCLGAFVPAFAGGPAFTDVTETAGVGLIDDLVESIAWGDYDNDDDEDLFLAINGHNRLYRNDGSGVWTEVAASVGLTDERFSVGSAWGDFDNDGDLDLYVVSFNSGPDNLYRNDGGTFTEIGAAAGIAADESSSRGVALIDFDQDGYLDVYVNAIGDDILYRNQGDLTFVNVAAIVGVIGVGGQGVGVTASDIDGDGRVDLYTGNRSGDLNRLFLNQGGTFLDVTVAAGLDAEVGLGMGVLSFDYDNDLDMDLYWTTWPGGNPPQPNAFYENQGDGTFDDVAAASGTEDAQGWGISINDGDVDGDGWIDFFVTNGFDNLTSPNVLFRNQADGTFADWSSLLGDVSFDGRGVAFADFDNDGDLDLCVTSDLGEDTRLWRNDSDLGNGYLILRLEGTLSNRSAIGAWVEVHTDLPGPASTQVREVSGGAGRGSQNSLAVEFGLGASTTVERVVIRWPSGFRQVLEDVALNQILDVVEPAIFVDGFESGDTAAWIVGGD